MNSQRIKSTSELVHETIVKTGHQQIINQRVKKRFQSGLGLAHIEPDDTGRRDEISAAKRQRGRYLRHVARS